MLIQSPQSPRSKSPKSPRGILKKSPEHPPAAPLPKAVERTPSLSETSNHSETSNLSECSSSSPRRRRRAIILDRPSAGSETESSDYELIDGLASAAAALKAAVEAEDVEAARALVHEHPAAVKQWRECRTLLHEAASDGSLSLVSLLLGAGAPLWRADEEGQTALHAACASEQVEAARLLSDQTPCWELTVEDNYQMTPLHLATESGVEPLVALLLERLTQLSGTPGADVDAIKQLRRGTVQFLAARHGFAGVLDLLRDDGGGAEGGAAGEAAAAVRASPDCSVSEEV